MTVDEAKAEARCHRIERARSLPGDHRCAGAAGQIPGYQANYPGLTQYYDNPGNMYADGAAAGYNSDAYRTANSTTRPTVDVTRADLSRPTP
jgi:conjugal transfer mating pair stabilization protein TraN